MNKKTYAPTFAGTVPEYGIDYSPLVLNLQGWSDLAQFYTVLHSLGLKPWIVATNPTSRHPVLLLFPLNEIGCHVPARKSTL